MTNELQEQPKVISFDTFRNIEEIERMIGAVQLAKKRVMKEGTHYGIIPGCGNKPTLLKPGAEMLCMLFKLRIIINPLSDIGVTELDEGHREYRVSCHIFNNVDEELSTGIGICTTQEKKYRFRSENTGQIVPKEYWDSKDPSLLGGIGNKARKVGNTWMIHHDVEYDNPADYYNTVLKMAKKRAFVDGVLTATSSSDMFTQDIEDLAKPTNSKQSQEKPQTSYQTKLVTDKQIGFLMKVSGDNGYSPEEVTQVVEWEGYKSKKDIPMNKFQGILDKFQVKKQ